jgi:hypothetical protein
MGGTETATDEEYCVEEIALIQEGGNDKRRETIP